jgi:hypothetical protein
MVLCWQLRYGHLPIGLVLIYYMLWVGVGGRMMGAGYALAHKEVTIFNQNVKHLKGLIP